MVSGLEASCLEPEPVDTSDSGSSDGDGGSTGGGSGSGTGGSGSPGGDGGDPEDGSATEEPIGSREPDGDKGGCATAGHWGVSGVGALVGLLLAVRRRRDPTVH